MFGTITADTQKPRIMNVILDVKGIRSKIKILSNMYIKIGFINYVIFNHIGYWLNKFFIKKYLVIILSILLYLQSIRDTNNEIFRCK